MTEANSARVSARTRGRPLSAAVALGTGIILLLLAVVVFGASRLIANGQRHAYDPGATPPKTYRLTAGKTYQLSSTEGIARLTGRGLLGAGVTPSCFSSTPDGARQPLTIVSTKDDVRVLQVFATFQVPRSGVLAVHCDGISAVFVDDADDSSTDYAALLTMSTTLLGLLGVIAVMSGGYALTGIRHQLNADPDPGRWS